MSSCARRVKLCESLFKTADRFADTGDFDFAPVVASAKQAESQQGQSGTATFHCRSISPQHIQESANFVKHSLIAVREDRADIRGRPIDLADQLPHQVCKFRGDFKGAMMMVAVIEWNGMATFPVSPIIHNPAFGAATRFQAVLDTGDMEDDFGQQTGVRGDGGALAQLPEIPERLKVMTVLGQIARVGNTIPGRWIGLNRASIEMINGIRKKISGQRR